MDLKGIPSPLNSSPALPIFGVLITRQRDTRFCVSVRHPDSVGFSRVKQFNTKCKIDKATRVRMNTKSLSYQPQDQGAVTQEFQGDHLWGYWPGR